MGLSTPGVIAYGELEALWDFGHAENNCQVNAAIREGIAAAVLPIVPIPPVGKVLRPFLRFFFEDRAYFALSREFFARYRGLFGTQHGWSLEHMWLKQRWYGGQNPVFSEGTFANKLLQGLGDAGWNLVPVPLSWNGGFLRNPVASLGFNFAVYSAAAGVFYGATQEITSLYHAIAGK